MPFVQTTPARQHSRYSFVYNTTANMMLTQVTTFDTNDAAEDDEWFTIGSERLSDAQAYDDTLTLNVLVPKDADQIAHLIGVTPPVSWAGTEKLSLDVSLPFDLEIRRYDKSGNYVSKIVADNVRWRTLRMNQSSGGDGYATWELSGIADNIYSAPAV